jgi:hypothetical protein
MQPAGAHGRLVDPLHLCPVCLRKPCSNLQVVPVLYMAKHRSFCQQHGLAAAHWYEQPTTALNS